MNDQLKARIKELVLQKIKSTLNEDVIPVQNPVKPAQTTPQATNAATQPTDQVIINDLKDDMSLILKGLDSEFAKASQGTTTPGVVSESLLTIASIAIALPAIMGLIARFGKAAGALVNKVMGKKPTDANEYQAWMDKLGKIADDLHHLYMTPITAIVGKFVKDPIKAKKVSSFIFHGIVAVLMLSSGVTAVKALHSKEISLGTLEAALAAVKGGELQSFISSALK